MKELIVALALLSLTGCTMTTPDAGEESVLIEKPMIFGHGGVDPEPVRTGRAFLAITTDHIIVNMQPRVYEVKFDDLMTSDGVPLSFDSKIRVQITDSVMLVKGFGPYWYENNLQPAFSNLVRQAVRKHGMNETAISTVAVDAIDQEVFIGMQAYVEKIKIPIRLLNVIVGKANPPDSIKNQRVETAAQEQRQQTEVQRTLAEDARKNAETARAVADNAYRQSLGLSPEQFVQLENINMQHDVCMKGSCTFILGGPGSPIIGVGK